MAKQKKRLKRLEGRLDDAVAAAESAAKDARKAARKAVRQSEKSKQTAKAMKAERYEQSQQTTLESAAPASSGSTSRDLDSMTRQDLLVLAREADVTGRSSMSKAELVAALR